MRIHGFPVSGLTSARALRVAGRRAVLVIVSLCIALLFNRPGLSHQPHDPVLVIGMSPAYDTDRTLFAGMEGTTVTLAAGTMRLLMKSTDSGLTWRVVPNFPNHETRGIGISPGYAADSTLFVATDGAGLLKSTDGGNTWTDVGLGTSVVAVALSPVYGAGSHRTLFAATGAGQLFKSPDGGTSWFPLSVGGSPVTVIAVSPAFASDATVIAGTTGQGIFISTNAGASWNPLNQGLTNLEITALVFSPSYGSDRTIFAGTEAAGVFVRQGTGAWTAANQGIDDPSITSFVISPAFSSDQTLFAASRDGGVFKTTNAGTNWTRTRIPRELSDQTDNHHRALGISPAFQSDHTVFLATFEGMWRSQDRAATWRYSDLLPTSILRFVSLSPGYATDQTAFASTYGGGIIRTGDGGQTWETRNVSLINCYPDPNAISPAYPTDRVVFAGTVFGLEKLVEGTSNWQYLSMLGVPVFPRTVNVSPNYASDQTVFMGTDNLGTPNPTETVYEGSVVSTYGLFKSVDGGINWAPTQVNGVPVHAIGFSPSFGTDATMYIASLAIGIRKSTDGGQIWTNVGGPPGTCCAADVVLSPNYASDQTVFAAMPIGVALQPGVYRSNDAGGSWTLIGGSDAVSVLKVAVSPEYATDGKLFVGTLERGLMVSQHGGALAPTSLAEPLVTALAVSPTFQTDRTIMVGAYAGLFKSTDGGATWTMLSVRSRYEEDRPNLAHAGTWTNRAMATASCTRVLTASTASDALQFPFVGSRVAWIGPKGPGQGIARVLLDGVQQANVDLYAPSLQPQRTLYLSPVLVSKGHVVTIIVTGQRNPSATDSMVIFDAFDVWR